MKRITIWLLPAAALLVTGCSSVYFYETDKISLTVEARPDMTGPIQGNFGLKQRVVAFVPPRNRNKPTDGTEGEMRAEIKNAEDQLAAAKAQASATTQPVNHATTRTALQETIQRIDEAQSSLKKAKGAARSDAMSVLSSLRFHKLPKADGAPFWKISHITIDAALITGEAAKVVAHPGDAIGALSGQTINSGRLIGLSALERIYGTLQEARQDAQSAAIVAQLDALAQSLPARYPFDVYKWENETKTNVKRFKKRGDEVPRQNFQDVISYWGQLEQTFTLLTELIARTEPFKIDQVDVNPLMKSGLAKEQAEVKELRDALRQTIASSPAIRQAINRFQETF
jgi:hypothetical protein